MATRIVPALIVATAIGLPVWILATYPYNGSGFDGLLEAFAFVCVLPISLWMVVLAAALSDHRAWARWPSAFTFWMVGGIAAELLVFSDVKSGRVLFAISLLLAGSSVIAVVMILPSTANDLRRRRGDA